MRPSLAFAILALAAVPVGGQASLFRSEGDASEEFGRVVACLGDLDGDGFDEVAIGSPEALLSSDRVGRVDVVTTRTQEILYTFFGDADGDKLGAAVANAGDVDNDGTDDIIAGAYIGNYARIWSGDDGVEIRTLVNSGAATDFFGFAVASAGDVDADDHDDVIVGADRFAIFTASFAQVFSGFDGSVIHTFNGNEGFDGFGNAVAGGGDVNGDLIPDVIVGQPKVNGIGPDSGRARVLSGFDGQTLYLFGGDAADDRFGSSVAFVDDVNGDGRAEFAVGAPVCDSSIFCSASLGYVRVFDGFSGNELYTLRAGKPFSLFGTSLSNAGDVNADGIGDLAIGISAADGRSKTDMGAVRVVSGLDGTTIYQALGQAGGDRLGASVAAGGDVNGDGLPDVFAGSDGGYGDALSIALARDKAQISLSAGGVQNLRLVAGPSHANAPAAILGTFQGTTPGIPMDDVVLPLNIGQFTPVSGSTIEQFARISLRTGRPLLRTLVGPGPMLARAGRLDGNGEAVVSVTIPAGALVSLSGLTLHHAYVVFDAGVRETVFASNPAALTFLP